MLRQTELTQPITYFGTTTLHALGSLLYVEDSAKVYRYVLCANAVTNNALAAGECLCADSGGLYYVNNDMAGGTGYGTIPMGVAISAITENSYGWIQVGGIAEVTITDGSVAANDFIVNNTGEDGGCDTMADGEEEQVFGVVVAADVGDAVSVLLRGLY
ncbi:hypothetical protein CMI37_05255 [Candidatus Pacearchaeota archaeon]|nr:hypothetical protein [Candidatus Pacearchaeota archaeon]|tara:strand:- start:3488 stop:3964 length:477 start_codon:yes stop_codon:yes gene_type:complete